jgi:predicted NBD/HSP70 family sugar kinase
MKRMIESPSAGHGRFLIFRHGRGWSWLALGQFLAPSLAAFGASCLVVGGSIAHSWELFEPSLRAELEPIETLEALTVAEQLDDAPLLGAAWWVASGQA